MLNQASYHHHGVYSAGILTKILPCFEFCLFYCSFLICSGFCDFVFNNNSRAHGHSQWPSSWKHVKEHTEMSNELLRHYANRADNQPIFIGFGNHRQPIADHIGDLVGYNSSGYRPVGGDQLQYADILSRHGAAAGRVLLHTGKWTMLGMYSRCGNELTKNQCDQLWFANVSVIYRYRKNQH